MSDMMTAAPKSRGKVVGVKVPSDSDTLHIGAFCKMRQYFTTKANDTDVGLTSAIVLAKRA
jgi:hypothetical protein